MQKSKRSYKPEWMDLGPAFYTETEYKDCLYQLDRVGRYLGGDSASFSAFDTFAPSSTSIVDVGCGGGLFTIRLAQRFPKTRVVGIDISSQAIEFAKQQLMRADPKPKHLTFVRSSTPQLHFPPQSFDIVTSTLVCHHLNDIDLVDFLKRAYQVASKGIILNDLHRHFLAQAGFACLAPLLFHNRLVTHDGLLSIQRSFKKQDWVSYIEAAGIPLNRCSIRWHWAFRWIVWIDTSKKDA